MRVRVRYFAGARAAAGVTEDELVLTEGEKNVADVLELIAKLRGSALVAVLPVCSFLLDGVAVRDQASRVFDTAELDVLPPFAGG